MGEKSLNTDAQPPQGQVRGKAGARQVQSENPLWCPQGKGSWKTSQKKRNLELGLGERLLLGVM